MSDTQASSASSNPRWRPIVARILTLVGVVLIAISIAANFVVRQGLDTDEFSQTAEELIADPQIRAAIAASLTDELFNNVDIEAELQEALPPAQQGLAGPIAGGMRLVAERLANDLLERPRFQELWVTAAAFAQERVVRLLDDEARFLETEDGVIGLDLRPMLAALTSQLPLVPNLADRLPENAGFIKLMDADELSTAQKITRWLRTVASWIWIPALLFLAGGVYLARDRRREVRAAAIGIIVLGVVLLALRRISGTYLVEELTTPADRDAGNATWLILTRLLADAAWTAIIVGLVGLIGVWLAGGSRGAAIRHRLAPYLADWRIAYGVPAVGYLLLVMWAPTEGLQRPLGVVIYAVLLVIGIEALRRVAAREAVTASEAPASPEPPPGGAAAT